MPGGGSWWEPSYQLSALPVIYPVNSYSPSRALCSDAPSKESFFLCALGAQPPLASSVHASSGIE